MPGSSVEKGAESAPPPAPPIDPEMINKGIEKMYKIYEKLNSATEKTTLEADFKELLEAVKRSDKEKRLASQFITRFLESFPLHYDEAINAMLDLCEDDDVAIRKQACKDLVTVCKKVSTFVPKIADVFSQLMQSEDTTEVKGLETCLMSLFHIDAQATLVGIFSQVGIGQDLVRERCLKFLGLRIKDLSPEIVNTEFEKCLLTEAQRNLHDFSGDDFKHLHSVILNLKVAKTVSGQQLLVDMVSQMLEMDRPFDASEAENFDRLLECTKLALPSFSNQTSSSSYLVYFCTNVLPNLGESVMLENGSSLNLEVLRMTADIAFHTKTLDARHAMRCITPVYKNLLELMPHPPEEPELNPKFEFSLIETLLFTFYKLGSFCPDFLNEDPERVKDFRVRLQYLARGTHAYMKRLREDLQGKRGPELRNDENRLKIQALKLTSNISAVIKDLFHTPPSYKSVVGLSWRPLIRSGNAPTKRHSMDNSAAAPNTNKQSRGENRGAIYQPPSGKFSSRGGNYSTPPRLPRGGGGGGGPRSSRGNGGMSGAYRGRRGGGGGRGRF